MSNTEKLSSEKNSTYIIVLVAILCSAIFGFAGYMYGKANMQKEFERFRLVYTDLIHKNSIKYGHDPYLVASIIDVESNNDPKAVSHAGAIGLMQIMPTTGEWIAEKLGESYSEEKLFDAETNIRYGTWYLNFINERLEVQDSAIAAYNAGQNRVAQWLANPEYSSDGKNLTSIPYKETDDYVKLVNNAYEKYIKLYGGVFEKMD